MSRKNNSTAYKTNGAAVDDVDKWFSHLMTVVLIAKFWVCQNARDLVAGSIDGLHPIHRRFWGLDQEDCSVVFVADVPKLNRSIASPSCTWTNGCNVRGLPKWVGKMLITVWAAEDTWHLIGELAVIRTVPRLVKVILLVELRPSEFFQNENSPGMHWATVFVSRNCGRKRSPLSLIAVQRHGNKLGIVPALGMRWNR